MKWDQNIIQIHRRILKLNPSNTQKTLSHTLSLTAKQTMHRIAAKVGSHISIFNSFFSGLCAHTRVFVYNFIFHVSPFFSHRSVSVLKVFCSLQFLVRCVSVALSLAVYINISALMRSNCALLDTDCVANIMMFAELRCEREKNGIKMRFFLVNQISLHKFQMKLERTNKYCCVPFRIA